MFFRKPGTPKGDSRPVASPPFERRRDGYRCVVESLAGMSLSGWAVSASLQPVEIELCCAGHVLPCRVHPIARADVLAHLGIPAGGPPLGFVLELPAQLWDHAAADAAVTFHLRLDGDDRDMPAMRATLSQLDEWLELLLGMADTAERRRAWERAQPHFSRCFPPLRWQQVQQRWATADADHCARQQLPGARLKWAIERQDGLCIVGWAADPGGGDDAFTLQCNGVPVAASAVRFERGDVRALLAPGPGDLPGEVRLDSGFELELPASLWAAIPPAQTATLQLFVSGRALLEEPLCLSREALAATVAEAAAATSAPDAAEQHYRSMLLLEHAIAAGIGPQLQPEAAGWLQALASRHGLELPGLLPQHPMAGPPADPLSRLNLAVWGLQRRFNAALDPAASAPSIAAALEACLTPVQDEGEAEAQRRFLVSMVPFFCAANALPALRPRLAAAELQTLTLAHGRWELSLLLPVTLLDELAAGTGRLGESAALMERLAAAADAGWLNSAAVLDTLRRLAQALETGPLDDAELARFIDASLRLLDSLGDDHGSRLYDEHLVHAAACLLALAAHAGEAALQRAAETVLRHFGLTPVFWQSLADMRPAAPLPAALQLGRAYFERLRRLWPQLAAGDAEAGPGCGSALRGLRELGCADVDSVQRQALLMAMRGLPSTGSPEAARGLRGLPAEDALRWLGRLPDGLAALAPGHDPDSVLELASPVPRVSHRPQRLAALQAMQAVRALRQAASPAAPNHDGERERVAQAALAARRACLAIAGERNGFVGLAMLAHCAGLLGLPQRSGASAALAPLVDALRTALARALAASERNRERHPVPAAALVAALSWLQQFDADGQAAFLSDCAQRLCAQWHGDAEAALAALPPAPALPVEAPGVGALVLVRLREGSSAAQAQRIQQGWGAELTAEGIPWAIWQQQAGAARLLHQGAPRQLHAASLIDLLAWLVEHSDFGHVLLLEDDAELGVQAWLSTSGAPAHHYHGLPCRAPATAPGMPLDKSPPGTTYATPGNGLGLSRYAVQRALALRHSARGARLARGSPSEEKWLGDLVALAGIPLSSEGHTVHQGRPPRSGHAPAAFHNLYALSAGMPTVLCHGAGSAMPPVPGAGEGPSPDRQEAVRHPEGSLSRAPGDPGPFRPRRLWPTDRTPRLANDGSPLQLVELSVAHKADALAHAACMVVAVARNERVLMPHFLAHYRALGARHFVIVDNLSDDGTREFLLAQDDVVVYSADTPYRQSRYGVTWQQTVLAAHGTGRWALLADIDEFLVWPGCETDTLPALCRRLEAQGAEAARVLMVDMYPEGPLEQADFATAAPFRAAPCFDAEAVLPWRLGSGSYSNGPTWVSGLRHRLLPGSAPNHYTSQKVALMRHQPWVRCSEGLHYATGLEISSEALAFAHFKYHRGFRTKVLAEVARKQHYNGAEEYRQYLGLLSQARSSFFDPSRSRRYENSQSFAPLLS